MIKDRIDRDLKAAMLSGDKILTTTLRGLKSAILYVEVAEGKRETGLGDEETIVLLQKEAKKRDESAELYAQGGNKERQESELAEKKVIEAYLPTQLSIDELRPLVKAAVKAVGAIDAKDMGNVISKVKAETKGVADGSMIAQITKEELGS